MVAAVVTIEVVMMIIKATVEGVHHIVGTLVIATSEKKVASGRNYSRVRDHDRDHRRRRDDSQGREGGYRRSEDTRS